MRFRRWHILHGLLIGMTIGYLSNGFSLHGARIEGATMGAIAGAWIGIWVEFVRSADRQ